MKTPIYNRLDKFVKEAISLLPPQGNKPFHEYTAEILTKAKQLIEVEKDGK